MLSNLIIGIALCSLNFIYIYIYVLNDNSPETTEIQHGNTIKLQLSYKTEQSQKTQKTELGKYNSRHYRLLFITQVWMNPKMMYRLLGCENGIVVGGVQNTGRGRFDGQHHSLLCKGLQIIEQNMLSPISSSSTFPYLLCAPTIS